MIRGQPGVSLSVPTSSTQIGSSLGTFATARLSMPSNHYSQMAYRPHATYEPLTQNNPMSRQAYQQSYGAQYEDAGGPFTSVAPAFTIPTQVSVGSNGFHTPTNSSRAWSNNNQERDSATSFYADPYSGQTYPSTSYPYVTSSLSYPAASAEPPTLFSGTATFPATASGRNRMLPDPGFGRQQATNPSPAADDHSTTSHSSGQAMSYKSGWSGPEILTPGSSQNSSSPVSSDVVGLNSRTGVLPPASNVQDMGFGYIPISHTPTDPSVSASAYTSAEHGSGYACSGPPLATSRESVLHSQPSRSECYSYSTDAGSDKRRSEEDFHESGTLMSGQQYQRLFQPQPQSMASIDTLRKDQSEYRHSSTHRTSIASLSNAGGY